MDLLTRKLLARIETEISTRAEHIIQNKAVDHADYKARCAYIQALRDVVAWDKDIQRELSRPEDARRPRHGREYMDLG